MAALIFSPSSSPHNFLPPIPSPLSPRSANIYGHRRHPVMSNDGNDALKPNNQRAPQHATSNTKVPFSQRPIKRAPPLTTTRDTRRDQFLRKVREGREDKRFEARGEDILRADWERERRKWEMSLSQSAPVPEEEEEVELPGWQQGSQMDVSSQAMHFTGEDEAEQFARDEDRELEALLEYMPNDEDAMDEGDAEAQSLWSDDADYDALFSEVLSQEEQQQGQMGGFAMQTQAEPPQQSLGEEMDMS